MIDYNEFNYINYSIEIKDGKNQLKLLERDYLIYF